MGKKEVLMSKLEVNGLVKGSKLAPRNRKKRPITKTIKEGRRGQRKS
jgi:hypothetical protein